MMAAVPGELGPLEALLRASHLAVPEELPGLTHSCAARVGARATSIYLVDLDQRWLTPLPREDGKPVDELSVDTTLAGRCYRSLETLEYADDAGDVFVWVPMLDGTERLGVVEFVFAGSGKPPNDVLMAFARLVAELIVTKGGYGDFFETHRRRKPLSVAAELLWQLLPPLTFGCQDLVISAFFLPTEDLGGDAFDYAVDPSCAKIAIFDAMGHDLQAGLMATAAVASYRNARRSKLDLFSTAEHIHRNILDHFGANRFVTGLLTSLEKSTGVLTCCIAGHPPPLLLRHGRVVKSLGEGTGMPFGIGSCSAAFQEQLEPGDRVLLYTDGVTEARAASGKTFELEELVNLISRTASDDPPPETMRRLMHAIEDHNDGPMRDDATVVMVEWRGQGASQLEV
jgi:hypothetical protein